MRQHEFTVDLPHSARRLWALFQRYDLWKEYAPAVLDVEIVYPGDAEGNGLLRRVVYPLPFGRRGDIGVPVFFVGNGARDGAGGRRHWVRPTPTLTLALSLQGEGIAPAILSGLPER